MQQGATRFENGTGNDSAPSSLTEGSWTTRVEPATSAVTANRKRVTLWNQAVANGHFQRPEEPLATLIGPLMDPRPLPCKPLPYSRTLSSDTGRLEVRSQSAGDRFPLG